MYCYSNCSVVCLSVCLSVSLLVTTVSPAKTTEPIEMSFRLWTRVGPRNRAVQSARGRDNFGGRLPSENALDCEQQTPRTSTHFYGYF